MASAQFQFCTLGMFIIDEIEYTDGKARAESIIGGAGTYAAIGARLVAGRENAPLVSWIVDVGSDFPPEFRVIIDRWQTSCVYRLDKNRLTTRAWNGYGPNDHRAFKYLTPKLRLEESSLSDTQAMAATFHMVCSPQRCLDLIGALLSRRKHLKGHTLSRPRFIWEPVPDLCVPEELELFRKALRQVDVVSPNAEEFAAYFATDEPPRSQQELAAQVVGWQIGPSGEGILVVREGSHGCSAYSRSWECNLPAFYQRAQSHAVVDPTGGGNTFLGALAMALGGRTKPSLSEVAAQLMLPANADATDGLDHVNIICALAHATVAASYAIQQTGMPVVSYTDGDDWNGESFNSRLSAYIRQEKEYIVTNARIYGMSTKK